MKRLPIVILVIVAASFLAFKNLGKSSFADTTPPTKYEKIMKMVGEMMEQAHYSPQQLDDKFSKKIFYKYINDLNEEKNIFLQSDVDSLFKKYGTTIDDEIKGAPVKFFLEAGKVFTKRMEEISKITVEILAKPFDYTKDESLVVDIDQMKYPATLAERKDNWRKKLKYLALKRYADKLGAREKNKHKEGYVAKSDEELEKEAREAVSRIMDRTFDRYRFKSSDDDKFNIFMNAITTTFDPHSTFFPPVDKRYFDEEMSGRFFGIGASLQYVDGNIKIASVLTGSPAWKSGQIQAGDIITKVAEGDADPLDLTGYSVTDAVKVIRGDKGTEVKLTLLKQDGSTKVVPIIRDEIVQDETFARSAVVNEGGNKIGYIFLPEFYADFDHPNGNRSYTDVAKEVIKLKKQNVDGIVIDLRNNGGGSLYDVVQMAGLFIKDGPVVQVKDRDNNASELKDKNRNVLYDGPLAVMVNELSASASEIFAAAIQDYGRGVIIGSTSTYGKGTVQRNIGIDKNGFSLSNAELGTVKLTLQKFYRINGGSTQLKGVSSDIVLPDNLEYLKVREKDDADALPWDEIKKVDYTAWNPGYNLKTIQHLSELRLKNDPAFNIIQNDAEWLAKQYTLPASLQLDKYRKEQEAINATVDQMDALQKLKNGMNVTALPSEANRWADDKNKQDRFEQWLDYLKTDIYLNQAVKVMDDMISQRNVAQTQSTEEKKKSF
ncbi:MAG: carboxy terminal-processing peptidase [Chitinophagaceae bacterium]